eukprot:COSAG05_NODE_15102_length_378_cov_1.118280_1_plen_53_part_01
MAQEGSFETEGADASFETESGGVQSPSARKSKNSGYGPKVQESARLKELEPEG